jgi:hypothetical protein
MSVPAWPRLHLMEWNDQPWLPDALRRAETDYLSAVLDVADPFAPLAPRLAELCAQAGGDQIVDLCAGGAGPWLRLQPAISAALGRPVRVTMTDLYPNRAAFARAAEATGGAVTGEPAPVDARAVPPRLSGVRTLFHALHHFRPADARAVLADAHRSRRPIVVVESTRRSAAAVLGMLLSPLFVLLITPRIRPWSWTRLLLTYVVPVVPLQVLWDGVVSCLRSYRPSELRALTAGLDEGYRWEIGEYRRRGGVVTYVIGAPGQVLAHGPRQPTACNAACDVACEACESSGLHCDRRTARTRQASVGGSHHGRLCRQRAARLWQAARHAPCRRSDVPDRGVRRGQGGPAADRLVYAQPVRAVRRGRRAGL